ncbi:hypothetical protein KMI_10g16200 [Encephalitozoon hellem]|nr:hypothetical protein KMI_10g16200 [Encephalitozoon hellem]
MNILRKCVFLKLAYMIMGMANAVAEGPSDSIFSVSNERKMINNYFSDSQIKEFLESVSNIADGIMENTDEIKLVTALVKSNRKNLSEPVQIIGDVFLRIFDNGMGEKDIKFFKDFFILVLVKLINIPDIVGEVGNALS